MLQWIAERLEVTTTVAALLLSVLVVQLATQAYALVDLARRRAVRGGKKLPWALVIVAGNLLGAIAYLAAGRAEPDDWPPDGGVGAAGGDAARRAVDVLYGRGDRR